MYDQREWDAAEPRSQWALKYRARLTEASRQLLAATEPGDLVLEIGSGQANCSLLLAEQGRLAVALDRDRRALTYALRKREQGAFHAVTGDALALPLADAVCRAVVAMEVLEHLSDPPKAVAEIARVLAPGGTLLLTAPNSGFLHERLPPHDSAGHEPPDVAAADADGHRWAFRLSQLRRMVTGVGLVVEKAGYTGSTFLADRNPLKRVLSPALVTAISGRLNTLPGAAIWSYTCMLTARKPRET